MKDLISSLRQRFRLLPLLVMVAMLTFAVRVGDAFIQVRTLSGSAWAAAETGKEPPPQAELAKPDVKAPAEPELAAAKPAEEKTSEEKPAEAAGTTGAADASDAKPPAWSDASDADIDYSNVRKELYQDLLQRRQQLDAKEKALAEREALVEAGEKEIGRKYDELTGLRNEIQDLLKKQSEEETARIASLVKIYEGMKAKDAARIFNTLDMNILLDVVSKMSERKSAPIIAEMEAERAKNLTTLLAEQKKLPELPPEAGSVPSN